MTEYIDILNSAIKTARKMYILETTRQGKLEWLRLCVKLKKERNQVVKGVIQ